ncbi:MAG: DNA cytosine methyltransferase [Chloroflexi bacterium]|nr:DNA cytosine methyltransferase [Chloroflexota bacterium]
MNVDTCSFAILSLSSGAAGLEISLRLALPTSRVVCYVERDAYACEVLASRIEDESLDEAPIWSDLRTFDGRPWCGIVDILSAGFPCQPWSAAGKRLGTIDDRWIWDDIARIVREVEPEWIFLENVPGLVRGGLEHVLRDLALCGFDAEWDVFSAAQVGAPQIRERVFILAHAKSRGFGVEQEPISQRNGTSIVTPNQFALAHTNGHGQPRQWGIQELPQQGQVARRDDADRCDGEGRDVADTEIIGRRSRRAEPTGQQGQDGVTGDGEPLAQPDECGCFAGERDVQTRQPDTLGLFPPGPSELDEWRRVLEVEPSLEPAICRMADGLAPGLVKSSLAYQIDQLRVLGNGVVPLVAAVAFAVLWQRLVTG